MPTAAQCSTSGCYRNPNRPGTGPTTGSSSCRSGVSCRGKWNFDLLDTPGGVGEGLSNIFFFKVGVCGQNFRVGWPEATSPTIAPTVTRIPRTQGLPPITSGFRVILSSPISDFILPPIFAYGRLLNLL